VIRFTFINTSRVGTAVQGVAAAELALQNSLWYCKDRTSMRALSGAKAPAKIADPIIWHPAVRAMLLTMKAYAEGGRSMVTTSRRRLVPRPASSSPLVCKT
jgi:alkylation response protein AidB-like acyl-CoA dehydrogenase